MTSHANTQCVWQATGTTRYEVRIRRNPTTIRTGPGHASGEARSTISRNQTVEYFFQIPTPSVSRKGPGPCISMFILNKSSGGEQPNDVFESSLVRRKEGIWQANTFQSFQQWASKSQRSLQVKMFFILAIQGSYHSWKIYGKEHSVKERGWLFLRHSACMSLILSLLQAGLWKVSEKDPSFKRGHILDRADI